jgi:NADH-quinone oxidoreductase subunit J
MTVELILFFAVALVSVGSALGMLFSRRAVYSALYLVLNFVTIALYYLILNGPFLALAQVSVYAGAIMVLFLFVIMLLGVEQLPEEEPTRWQRPLAIILGVALLAEAAFILIFRGTPVMSGTVTEISPEFGTPWTLADVLFNQYALPVELVGVLLLVAMVGVIVMVKNVKKGRPDPGIEFRS